MLAVEFIGHPNHAALSCADGNLTVWNLETYTMLRFAHTRTVQVGLRFCPSMDVLVSWGGGELRHDILVWDAGTLSTLRVLNDEHFDAIKDVCEMAWTTSPKGGDAATEMSWEPMIGEKCVLGHAVHVQGNNSTLRSRAIAYRARSQGNTRKVLLDEP